MTDHSNDSSGKAWSGRFSEPVAELVKRYTASVSFDRRLAFHDIRGSLAIDGNPLAQALFWIASQADNPFACTTMAEAFCILVTVGVSLVTRPLPQAHLDRVFGVHPPALGPAGDHST
mgnify:CR=1 FL=1